MCINEDQTEELGVQGQKKQVIVNIASDQQMKFGLESIDGKAIQTNEVKTSQKICGGIEAFNWVKYKIQVVPIKGNPFIFHDKLEENDEYPPWSRL